jgi:6-pyruvoyltetrahydropterin/6-carboxytetrahydropterin synthase
MPMSFEVGVVARFTARHHLVGNFGPASQPHSHDYRVEAMARGRQLLPDGTLFDITALQGALSETLAKLHDADLNTIGALEQPNPSAEVVARFLYERIAPALIGSGVEALSVRVWESDEAFAAYSDDLPTTS